MHLQCLHICDHTAVEDPESRDPRPPSSPSIPASLTLKGGAAGLRTLIFSIAHGPGCRLSPTPRPVIPDLSSMIRPQIGA